MKRHNARIIAVMTLYNMDMSKLSIEETMEQLEVILNLEKEEEFPVEIDEPFSRILVEGTMSCLEDVDKLIASNLKKYSLDRLSYVDRALIRAAVYEMKYIRTPKEVVINEAIEITREYSSLDNDLQVKFNNSVLDSIAKVIYE